MRILHQFALVYAITHHVTHAFPLPPLWPLEVPAGGEYLSPAIYEGSRWNSDVIKVIVPVEINADNSQDNEDIKMDKRGVFGVSLHLGTSMIKAAAKSGVINAAVKGVGQVLKIRPRDLSEGDEEGEGLVRRSLEPFYVEQTLMTRAGFARGIASFRKVLRMAGKKTMGAAKKTKGPMKVAGDVAMVASVGSMVVPLLGGGSKKKADLEKPATSSSSPTIPTKISPLKEPSQPARRSLTEMAELKKGQTLTKRGQVGNIAGGVVTTLMFVNIGKQAWSAIAPHHNRNAPQYSRRSGYDDGSGYYSAPLQGYQTQQVGLYKRDKDPLEEMPPRAPSGPESQASSRRRTGVMDGMGSVVTIGFALQAIQEHRGSMYKEAKRMANKALSGVKKVLSPKQRPMGFSARSIDLQDSNGLYPVARQASDHDDSEETLLIRRGMTPAMKAAVPRLMTLASHIVTVSMVTGLAGPVIDSTIATLKGPQHKARPQGMAMQPPMRRSSTVEPGSSIIYGGSSPLPEAELTSDSILSTQSTRRNLNEKYQSHVLEKRMNIAKVANKVFKNKVVSKMISIASLAI